MRPSAAYYWLLIIVAAATFRVCVAARTKADALPDGKPYEIGHIPSTSIVNIWVDPRGGAAAWENAWGKVPARTTLKKAYYINIKPGNFSANEGFELENRWGTYKAPVIVKAVNGPGTVNFNSYVSVIDCRYLYFIDLNINFAGDEDGDHPFHCEACIGLLMRRVRVRGTLNRPYPTREVVKLNQCRGVYIEHCDFAVSTDNAIDAVAVQYGHVINSELHDVGFGVYFKGGSAYIIMAGNRVHHTGELGIAAGYDTGFEWMTWPWVRYEAYDIKVINNVIHDVDGAPGISVHGGYNVLFAYNTLYRVGRNGHVIGIRCGTRSCDGGGTEPTCAKYFTQGGWGPDNDEPWKEIKIPNKNVIIANNLVYNPDGYKSADQHFYISKPESFCSENSSGPCKRCKDLPSTVVSDANLYIRGNLIWNGDKNMPLGLEWDSGCKAGTCTPKLVEAQNNINNLKPDLQNPKSLNFRPKKEGSLAKFSQLWKEIPSFGMWSAGLSVPEGSPANIVLTDRDGKPRTPANNAPGAYVRP